MKKVAIIYICTGPYIAYWKNFYDSFESKFLPNWEKHFFVFTDNAEIYQKENARVHYKYQMPLPWPLITLLKFQFVLEIEEELKKYDFIYMSNANIICEQFIEEKDILPRPELGEHIVFTHHPGCYIDKRYNHPYNCEYERDPNSLAYIPYNKGKIYVYGNMHGGYTQYYIALVRELARRINEDLKKGKIAKWHDESHVNHYAATHDDYRVLDPGYCYPVGFEVPFERKIVGVPKDTVFNVNDFKGYYSPTQKNKLLLYIDVIYKKIIKNNMPFLYFIRDKIFNKKPAK